jgi:hypothetical protein
MPPEEVQGVLDRAFSNFARDIDTAKTHLSRLAEGSVIVGAVRGMRPEDQAALATSFVPGVGDAAGLYADYTDIRENWDQVPWHSKAAMVGAAALGAVPFVPSRSQVNAGAEVARGMTIAYHGSPHDFPPVRELQMPDGAIVYQSMDDAIPEGAKMLKEHPLGRFNMSKIGTGEGAQAYGHGLYFAESEDVARGYRDDLDRLRGQSVDDIKTHEPGQQAGQTGWQLYDKETGYLNSEMPIFKTEQEAIDFVANPPKGRMYQVEIDASPDEFLDWDLPLSEQSAVVKRGLSNLRPHVNESSLTHTTGREFGNRQWDALDGDEFDKMSGGDFNKRLSDSMSSSDWDSSLNAGSDALRGEGIKGIRYKDGFSRGADGGTSNYVVFDENLISIARKYGIAIPAAAAMLARQTGQNPQDLYEDDSGA